MPSLCVENLHRGLGKSHMYLMQLLAAAASWRTHLHVEEGGWPSVAPSCNVCMESTRGFFMGRGLDRDGPGQLGSTVSGRCAAKWQRTCAPACCVLLHARQAPGGCQGIGKLLGPLCRQVVAAQSDCMCEDVHLQYKQCSTCWQRAPSVQLEGFLCR